MSSVAVAHRAQAPEALVRLHRRSRAFEAHDSEPVVAAEIRALLEELGATLDDLQPPSTTQLADSDDPGSLLSMAQLELGWLALRVESAEGLDALVALHADVAQSIRRLLAALTSSDSLDDEDARVGVTVRAECARLRHVCAPELPPTSDDARVRVRSIGNALARLFGLEAISRFRADDRRVLSSLRERIASGLREGDGPSATPLLLGLWQDAVATIELLHEINRRTLLRDRDVLTIAKVTELLARDPVPTGAVWTALADLLGRSRRLDALILGLDRSELAIAEVRRVLGALQSPA